MHTFSLMYWVLSHTSSIWHWINTTLCLILLPPFSRFERIILSIYSIVFFKCFKIITSFRYIDSPLWRSKTSTRLLTSLHVKLLTSTFSDITSTGWLLLIVALTILWIKKQTLQKSLNKALTSRIASNMGQSSPFYLQF